MTNYEKIMQEMTLEKMALEMMCPYDGGPMQCVSRKSNCIECCEEWLKKEVYEDAEM